MRWTTDLSVGAIYFELRDATIEGQRALSPGVLVDVDADGSTVGVELLGEDARHTFLSLLNHLDLTEDEQDFVVAVITSQVYGDRAMLGIEKRPPVESADSYRELQLQA